MSPLLCTLLFWTKNNVYYQKRNPAILHVTLAAFISNVSAQIVHHVPLCLISTRPDRSSEPFFSLIVDPENHALLIFLQVTT
jgi:hypothetical protein